MLFRSAPDSPLIIDGNAGVPRAAATELVRGLKRLGIRPAVLEQWLAKGDHAGARELADFSGWPVAADESVTTAAEAREVVAARAAQVINIKLMKAGLAEALLAGGDLVALTDDARRPQGAPPPRGRPGRRARRTLPTRH